MFIIILHCVMWFDMLVLDMAVCNNYFWLISVVTGIVIVSRRRGRRLSRHGQPQDRDGDLLAMAN